MSTISGKTALITGASSGIGEATALALADRSANVVLAARRKDRLDALAEKIVKAGETAHAVAIECDVTNREDVRRAVDQTIEDFGSLDVLINNAGVMPLAPMSKCRFDDWDRIIDVNIRGALYAIGCALPAMSKAGAGHIVNISSTAGRGVFPNAAVYCGSKHALHAISEGLRAELSAENSPIRVTVIAPGVVMTELRDSITDQQTRSKMDQYVESMQGPLQSEDIASSVMYALEAPSHVDVNEILIRPVEQPR